MTKQIGWQKYEEMLKEQMDTSVLYPNGFNFHMEDYEEDEGEVPGYEEERLNQQEVVLLPVPDHYFKQIAIVASYDCWVGHTDFDITQSILNKLKVVKGIEVLKVLGRYRFFIGLGKMFKFSAVRKDIEKIIMEK